MAVDGTWKCVMQTPIGERKSTLTLASQGGTLTGTLTGEEGNSTPILEGTANGDDVAFKASIKSPMPLTLQFTAKVSGNAIAGNVSASGVGNWGFTGTRA